MKKDLEIRFSERFFIFVTETHHINISSSFTLNEFDPVLISISEIIEIPPKQIIDTLRVFFDYIPTDPFKNLASLQWIDIKSRQPKEWDLIIVTDGYNVGSMYWHDFDDTDRTELITGLADDNYVLSKPSITYWFKVPEWDKKITKKSFYAVDVKDQKFDIPSF